MILTRNWIDKIPSCQFDHPLYTHMSMIEDVKQNVFIFLETIFIERGTRNDSRIGTFRRCGFFERYFDEYPQWTYSCDCEKSMNLIWHIFVVYQRPTLRCFVKFDYSFRIFNHCYVIMKGKHYSELPLPSNLSITQEDFTKLKLSLYLTKSSNDIKQGGLLVDRYYLSNVTSLSCLTYKYNETGILSTWISVPSQCDNMYTLCKQPVQLLQSFDCRSSEFACQDGTCILQHHHCDGERDCPDGSDEIGCSPACYHEDTSICFEGCFEPICVCTLLYFQCAGKCIPFSKLCDGVSQCADHHDESNCPTASSLINTLYNLMNELITNDTVHELLATDMACSFNRHMHPEMSLLYNAPHLMFCLYHECPGMYKCHRSYCIPYRYICDQTRDCPAGEDERGCTQLSCPGLMKCKSEKICLAPDEVCDGTVHCSTSMDDEQLCGLQPCPPQCFCYGLAVSCTHNTRTIMSLPELDHRLLALDLDYNHIILSEGFFSQTAQLLRLNLSLNNIGLIPQDTIGTITGLDILDVSQNCISVINPVVFTGLQNVIELSLCNNVIKVIRKFGFYGLSSLALVDLHKQHISILSEYAFSGMDNLQTLNLSFNAIRSLKNKVFAGLASIKVLDIQHNNIQVLDVAVLSMLENLSTIFLTKADLCCFLSVTIKCIFTEYVDIKCARIFEIRSQLIVVGIFSAFIICFNMAAIILLIRGHSTLKSALGDSWMAMHLSDSLHGLHLIVLIVYDTLFGDFLFWRSRELFFKLDVLWQHSCLYFPV